MSGPENPWLGSSAPRGDAYDARFEALERSGADVHGEADFVASLGATSVLDAGCGTGRVAVELARRGLDVVGVDLDPAMLGAARRKAPGLDWRLGDLATVRLGRRFDAVVAAGNVVIFLAPGTEAAVVANLADHLAPGGALVAGFSLGPGASPAGAPTPTGAVGGRLGLAGYDAAATAAGLALAERWATWDRAPYAPGGDYAVSVHRRRG